MEKETFFINNKSTAPLEWELQHIDSLEEFEARFSDELLKADNRIGNYLAELVYKYDKKMSVVSVEAGCSAAYVGNIINGKANNPSRNVLISICLVIGTTFDEAQYLLKYAGHAPLYVRNKRDVVIWFGFMKNHSLDTVCENLSARNLDPLYSAK